MATNSIIDNLDSKDMISTIKLEMGADINKEKVFLIVEGTDDKKFFKYFCQKNVSICESYSGKKGIEEILYYFKKSKNIIGIRDKDYENRKLDDRILFYDYCNMEMMLISDDEVFEKIICEYYNGEKEYLKLRSEILINLIPLSSLRKVNENEKKMWNFNGIDYNLILNDDYEIEKEKIYESLQNINKLKNTEDFTSNLDVKKRYTYKELLNITNGHDFLKLLCIYCKRSSNKKNIKDENLIEALRCGFGNSNFKNTNLYNSLKSYQKTNKIKIV